MKTNKSIINYLNRHMHQLISGEKLTAYGNVYWLNNTTWEIYSHSTDDEILGSISGNLVAKVNNDCEVVATKEDKTMKIKGMDVQLTSDRAFRPETIIINGETASATLFENAHGYHWKSSASGNILYYRTKSGKEYSIPQKKLASAKEA